jgi:predicted HAD superfamily phosphohydrolase YqeG
MIKTLDVRFDQTAIMGDQFVIDIWLANRIGCTSILVLPMIDQSRNASSNWLIKFLDHFIYRRLEYINYLPIDNEREGDVNDSYQII